MRNIINFQSKHVDTYFIVKKQIQFLKEFLKLIFLKFDHWMKQSTKNIVIKQFLKLLIYLRMIFFQNSSLFRTNYVFHFLWRHEVFNHFLYTSFIINVFSRFENKNRNLNS